MGYNIVMNEITAITPQIKDKTRCNIYVDGRFYCGLGLELAIKHRLKVGMAVDEQFLGQIQLDGEKAKALDKALTHISATVKTEKEIRSFLQKKGYLSAVCDYVVEKMKDYRFVDDKAYAESYVAHAGAKKGGRLIKMELKAKGIAEDEIDDAISLLDEQTQKQSALCLLQKYMRGKNADRETLAKAFRYLMSKGYEYETARSALAEFGDIDE